MPANMAVPTSPEQLVQVVTDNLAGRFGHCDRDDIEARVRACHQRLADGARISEHLAVLVEHEVADHLRAEHPAPAPH